MDTKTDPFLFDPAAFEAVSSKVTPVKAALRGGEHAARTVQAVMRRARLLEGEWCLEMTLADACVFVADLDRHLENVEPHPSVWSPPEGEHVIDLR
jgi:hypothetical protein